MKTEVYRCEGDCGLLYPLLVDRRNGRASCVACGSGARLLNEADMLNEFRQKVTKLIGAGPGEMPRDLDASPVSLRARIQAAEEVGELLRFMENQRDPRGARGETPFPPQLR